MQLQESLQASVIALCNHRGGAHPGLRHSEAERTHPALFSPTHRTHLMHAVEYAIVGAGASGSIIGAHLVRAGHSVAMIVREHRGAQLRRNGLRIRGLVDFAVPVTVITDASELRRAEVLIVGMKTPGTEAALAGLGNTSIVLRSRYRMDCGRTTFSPHSSVPSACWVHLRIRAANSCRTAMYCSPAT